MKFAPDFTDGRMYWKSIPQRHRELLPRACGMKIEHLSRKPESFFRLVDGTPGWLEDAFLMARLGAEVYAFEKNDQVFHALKTSMDEYASGPLAREESLQSVQDILSRIHLAQRNCLHQFRNWDLSFVPDAVYLDPFFGDRHRAALPKKEMQALWNLTSKDEMDLDQDLTAAALEFQQSMGIPRVVVKRPLKLLLQHSKTSNFANLPKPDASYLGKMIRFDCYFYRGKTVVTP